ncbi:MAG: RDD family protein [Bryobacteraceae bacterium]|jgi:uncharacterized RDD family membrane protein YckC
MDWYYSDGRQQFGPVTQAEFDTLVASGRIGANTLVWRAGMPNWAPLGTVQQPAPVVAASPVAVAPAPEQPQQQVRFCNQCGKPFAPADLLQIGNTMVCAACKDVMMQRLREGAVPGGLAFQGRQFAGFWIRFVAVLIDGIILGVVGAIINIPFNLMMAGMGTMTDPMAIFGSFMGIFSIMMVLNMAIAMAYESWFVVNKGATPGKLVLSLEVIRADGTRPGWGLAIGRYFAKILSSWPTIWIGYIMAGIDDEKRGLHDRICDTRVIRK